jgi:hypothetical protein
MGKLKRPKKVTYQLIPREDAVGAPTYALLERLVAEHHEELAHTNARIAVAWCTSWKSDVDGRVTIGKCKKASDLDRELAAFDFIILLSKDFWIVASEKQRAALVDHELMHAAVKYDADGEPVRDERGRQVFRTRKHDLEEFSDIAARHGCYKRDLEQFARALDRARAQTGTGWIGYSSLSARLEYAGLRIPVDRIVEWSESERRQALEWVNLRRELQQASSGGAPVPPAPAFVLAAVVQPSVLEQTGA